MVQMKKTETSRNKRPIESYEHRDKQRVNNPPVGLVTPDTDPDTGQKKKTYAYDPHLDPQLVWAGKAEHTSFEVPTVSLHVHERIEPRTILEAVRKKNGQQGTIQLGLFEEERREPLREAIEFYQHRHGWSNRLIAGDSLLVMNSLLEKEGLAGKVQMIYIDPPYGIKYGSNFQPFVNKRDVKDGKDEDLTAEPEQIRAFRDTWELGIHSYLTYLRDRLLLARELLTESGSIFVQISDENVHHVRELMDEVFGAGNFQRVITIQKRSPQPDKFLSGVADYLIWFSKDRDRSKYNQLYWLSQGECNGNEFVTSDLTSSHEYHRTPFEHEGQVFSPGSRYWSTSIEGLTNLARAGRLVVSGSTLRYKRFNSDWPCQLIGNIWGDVVFAPFLEDKLYAVQTSVKILQRCILMTTDPGDLVFDPTCVRKGTRVWRVDEPDSSSPVVPTRGDSPPVVPPQAGGHNTPSPRAGRAGEGPSPSQQAGRAGEGPSPSQQAGRAGEGLSPVPIETLQPGAYVLGHDGLPHRVLRVIRRTYKGTMVGIRHALCDQTLWLTADHKVLAHKRPHNLGGNADWSGIPTFLRGRSRELRKNMTPPERKLWRVLRGDGTGFTFRRQHPIGRYIADFYCREAALVVEVDGAMAHSHHPAIEHDRIRDEFLRSLNLRTLRFPAVEVERNLEGVYTAIQEACREQFSPEHAQWIEAEQLEKGDIVFYGPHRSPVRVEEVVKMPSEEEVYDLEVEGAHSFITEVCAVHNCGSGTTAYVAEQWGRRWITRDTSRVALRSLRAAADAQSLRRHSHESSVGRNVCLEGRSREMNS